MPSKVRFKIFRYIDTKFEKIYIFYIIYMFIIFNKYKYFKNYTYIFIYLI